MVEAEASSRRQGTILGMSDAGASWSDRRGPMRGQVYGASFIEAGNGIVVGDMADSLGESRDTVVHGGRGMSWTEESQLCFPIDAASLTEAIRRLWDGETMSS